MVKADSQANGSRGFAHSMGRVLASPWFPWIAVAIGLLLTCRAVGNGLDADDYYHRAVLNGSSRYGEKLPDPQGMFRFLPGDPEFSRELMDMGFLPWWSYPNIKAEFLQFIPTQTHILDYWLWPDSPELMHVHSLVWFALLVFLTAQFYRRMLGPTWMAGVAALLFAIEDGHGMPVGWIANRNILIAASFGVGCLMAHDVWRREGQVWAMPLAVVLWALCLCSKEAGIATSAYLFAYALWIDGSAFWQRFLTMLPYGIVLVVWRIVRDALGFGVTNVGYYYDPITDPGQFGMALVERFPVLLFGQWGMLSDLWLMFGELGSLFWWSVVAYICLLGLLLWPVVRRDRIARFFATGMLLAVIPICATTPSDRLLMFVGLGAFGLMVRFWYAVFAAVGLRPQFAIWRKGAVPVAIFLMLLHLVVAPVFLPIRIASFEAFQPFYVRVPFDESIKNQDLVVVNSPIPFFVGFCLFNYEHEGMPSPRAVRTLAPGMSPVTVKRIDERTLEITPDAGYIGILDALFRNEYHPLHLGEHVHIARMRATVLALTDDGRPQTVAFQFERPLEDASLRWLCFQEGKYIDWTPPRVGEQVILMSE